MNGRIAHQFSEALLDAYLPEQLDQLLYYRLDKQRHRITMKTSYDAVVFDLIRTADSEGWFDRLVVAARQSRPGHVGLFRFAQDQRLAVDTGGLESILNTRAPEVHPAQFRGALGVIEGQVCRVESGTTGSPQPLGTGFLIGPDLCMTSYHVVEGLFTGAMRPTDIQVRFDFKLGHPHGVRDPAAGEAPFPGTVFRLAEEWSVASAPYSAFDQQAESPHRLPAADELDFAVMRLAESPGDRPMGERAEPGAAGRGWVKGPGRTSLADGDDILVMQHLMGGPMRLTFGKVLETNANGTRIRHTADTDIGSSGSPCFTLALELVAIHQAGDPHRDTWHIPAYNRAVPAGPVFSTFSRGTPAPPS
ncbi:effector-associated domain EAD1-containing protein [Streptomyces sp. NPDC055025]